MRGVRWTLEVSAELRVDVCLVRRNLGVINTYTAFIPCRESK